ncbi:MAG: hypothetical protein DRR06_14065 [Gammaproteobacteria bacterium]|nr:MAG: hypothetical protein DRR06_14065 [Gammaproteobacteria bacterium]
MEVGGEGLIAFYDKNLPNVFKKVARKLDKKAGVSMADIRNAEVELVRGKVTFGWDSSQQMTSFMDDVINVGLDNEEYKLKVHMEGFVEFRDLPPSTYKDFENFADSNEGIIEITGRSVGREETFVAQGIDITPTLSNTAMERGQTLFRAEGTGTGSSNILFRKEETETREYTEGQQAAIDRGGFGKQSPSEKLKTKWESAKHRFKTKLRQGMVDQFASLKDVLEDDRAWMMAHLTSSAPGAVEAIIKHGQPYLKENAIAINTETSGLQEIIKPLGSEMDDWLAWMAGYRADRLKQEGRENLFEIEDIEALKSLSDGEMSGGRNREEVYQSTRKEFEKLGNSITQVAVDTGLIGEEEAKIWNEQGFYVPFYRTLEEGEARGPRALGGLAKQTAYKKLKGGTSQLNDLMTNVLMNWNHLISASLKNQAASHALQAAVDMGIATKVSSKAKSKDAIYVREDGKEQWFELNDDQDGSLVLDSLVSLNWSGLNTRSMKMMGVFKRALTRGVTLNPEFRIANGMRDTLTAIAVAPMSKNFAKNVAQGWKAAGKESDTLIQMLAGGGAFGTSGYIDGTSPEAIKRLVDMGVNKDTILDPRGTLKKAFDAYEAFGARTENMNRAANYEQALEKDKDLLTANFESRDHLDFTRTGSFMAVRALARVVPFLNARMQGIDKLSRAAMDKNQQAQFATVVGMYTLASIALMLAMRDDDDYEEAQEWEKDAYHLFKLPGSDVLFRLPRPFEVGAIGAMSERVLQQFIDDEATGKLFAERLSHTLLETFSMNPIPQAAKPLIELYANKSFFTGRDIESMSQQRLSPERRVRSTTTDTAKALSKAAAAVLPESATLSPLQIDHLVRGYLGWAGTTILGATDMLVTRPISGAPERPARHITEYPVIKRFARSGVPYSTKFTQIYYDRLRELNQVYADISDAKKQGEFEEARSMQKDSASKLRYRSKINRVNKNIQNMRRRINNIRGSGHYTPKQQRKEIDAIQSRINRLQKITVQSSDKAFN